MNTDFRDLVAEFLRADARFLIVGAHALAIHGVPRATADLDLWIDHAPDNARRVWTALRAFGAPLDDLRVTESDLTRSDVVAQFGLPPFRIDVMTGVSGVGFDEAWPQRFVAPFGDLPAVPYIGRAEYVRNKRASGRGRDLADLELLGER